MTLRKFVNVCFNNAIPYFGSAVRYYNQRRLHWYFRRYGDLRAGNAACGPFAAAIAISSLTGRRISPSVTMKFAVERGFCAGGTYESFVPAVMKAHGVSCREVIPPASGPLMEGLDTGASAIALMKARVFSRARHYVFLRMLPGGKCRVYDSSNVLNCYRSFSRSWLAERTDVLWILGPLITSPELHCACFLGTKRI